MSTTRLSTRIVGLVFVFGAVTAIVPAVATAQEPATDDPSVIASVNGEPITLPEFAHAVAGIHERAEDGESMPGGQRLDGVLQRLITVRLVAQESRNIGLDQTDEVDESVRAFRNQKLRELLYARQVDDITTAEPDDVRRRYMKKAGEVRMLAVRFADEDRAKTFRGAVDEAGTFDEAATAAVSDGRAVTTGETEWIPIAELIADLADLVVAAEPGEVIGPLTMGEDIAVARILEFRDADDADARREAEREAIEARRMLTIARYAQGLEKRYATIDRERLEALDFDGDPEGFEAALEDDTVLATIDGGEAVTMADLAGGIRKRFFHGADRAAEKGRLNRMIKPVLDDLIVKQTTVLEARKQGIDESEEFLVAAQEHENGVLFGRFVEKVIDPGIQIDDGDVRAYYEANASKFRTPELARLESIPFLSRADADKARARFETGAEFAWIRLNSAGQVRTEDKPGVFVLRGNVYMADQLPDGVREAVRDTQSGRSVLVDDPIHEGVTHLVLVLGKYDPATRPYEEVQLDAARMLIDELRQASVDEWARRLREVSEIEVRVTSEQLRARLLERLAS